MRPRAAAEPSPAAKPLARNYDPVAEIVAKQIEATKGRITAKRLLPIARAQGYTGSARNFRRLVEFRRWRAADVRSILAAGIGVPVVTPPGADLVLTLPRVPTRSLSDYAIAAGEQRGAPVSAS